ncbi:SET domain protein [Aspergillus sclerotialis]|uniref:SET domain protein n=1 Tax=Aspergillus sclerotialis TaxID=2070753 RepID=A0A3A3A1L2_9EURO|nr:SET domain protein [Aspergillus sclerotialis]
MLTVNSIPPSFISKFPSGISVHGILAAFLTHGDPEDLQKYDLWKKVWPSRRDFEETMPILWPECLRVRESHCNTKESTQRSFLPPSISGCWNTFCKQRSQFPYESSHQNLLEDQEKRLQIAWNTVVAVFPNTDWETFSYHWLIVNTRSFYFLMPGQEPPEDRNDAMALLPFADYFNHSDLSCDVNFDGDFYVFRAAKCYNEGEEIYMSYGPHPNDFLFAEYGFFLDNNDSEAIYLDDIIFRDLNSSQQDELHLHHYYGEYQVTATGVCFRTEIAACVKYMTRKDWQNYVLGHSTKGVNSVTTRKVIQAWIHTYTKEAETAVGTLRSCSERHMYPQKIEMLLKRWAQIICVCVKAIDSISG